MEANVIALNFKNLGTNIKISKIQQTAILISSETVLFCRDDNKVCTFPAHTNIKLFAGAFLAS